MSKNLTDKKDTYNYSPKASTATEYRDEEKPNLDAFNVPVEEGGTASGNLKITGGQNNWGALRSDLSLKNLGERSFTSLNAGSIKIPSSQTPLFFVDSKGNVTAESLRRNDFHWYTLFESISGYNIGGSNVPTITTQGIDMTTGATSGNSSDIKKLSNFTGFKWGKKRQISTVISIDSDFPGGQQTFLFGAGNINSANARKIIFEIDDDNVNATMGDGTTEESVTIGTIAGLGLGTNYNKFTIEYDPNTGAKYYINDVLKATLSTNIPSGTTSAREILSFDLTTDENVAKTVVIDYYDFWQAL